MASFFYFIYLRQFYLLQQQPKKLSQTSILCSRNFIKFEVRRVTFETLYKINSTEEIHMFQS